jgi:hypothetical protein
VTVQVSVLGAGQAVHEGYVAADVDGGPFKTGAEVMLKGRLGGEDKTLNPEPEAFVLVIDAVVLTPADPFLSPPTAEVMLAAPVPAIKLPTIPVAALMIPPTTLVACSTALLTYCILLGT